MLLLCVAAAWLLATVLAPVAHAQGEGKRILLYTGTTGFRHSDAINNGRPVVQSALEGIGFTVDWEDCTNNGGGANNCDNADKNPRIFTDTNLARYDAIVLLNSSAGPPGPLWSDAQKAAIISYVQNGGGIAGVHNATDMGTTAETWNWWDGNNPNSVVGSTMRGHAATNLSNVAQVQVEDNHHLATRELPDTYGFGDEHYNFNRNVRGSHHVLANLDERTYAPGGNAMGQDHPVTWCKLYDGDNVDDNTGTPKAYNDGRTWVTSMGHFGASYTESGGNNNLIKQIVGGVRWVAGDGKKSDCSGTNWSSFTRTVLVSDANGPIGIDVAKDGKVYWSEIGNPVGYNSQGYIKMHDPTGPANNKTTVATILTRADHGNSEDGVLGMSLQPDFDLDDPAKRNVFVYYSPRPGAGDNWPTTGASIAVGYNQISRFTLNAAGTEVVPDSERVILRVPKAKISGSPSGFPGGPTDSGPGHVGGAGLDFDSDGNLYLGVGDDVSPNASGHSGYPPMDYRATERWDARKTSANSADLRGKVVRIKPLLGEIPAGATPGVDTTYAIPAGNMFAPGTPNTRPEIYAMGFRQPFTLHTDPNNSGIVGVGEYCHDNSSNGANRAPAGTCEWNLVGAPGFFGWPLCVGNNAASNTSYRWNYANQSTTGQQYDCSQSSIPSDINWAPEGQTAAAPTFQGLENLPGPAVPATIWKKYTNEQGTADFGDLSAGGMQPVAGPIYRFNEATAGQGAFPRYYDGAWFINNRGADNGFWKEVRLRQDNNQFLRVNNWMPYNQAGTNNGSFNSLVIGTQFSPAGELYMARYPVTCCRNNTNENQQTQIVKISFNVQDECLTDTSAPNTSHEVTGQPYPGQPNVFVNSATLRLSATDVGCSGVEGIEYRVNGETDWHPYSEPLTFTTQRQYSVEYRATDRMDNVAASKTATFEVLEIDDETAPTTNATAAGNKDQRDYYIGAATVTITATDDATGSGVDTVEYRVNGGDWNTYTAPVAFNAPGDYAVDYRATDKVQNTSEPKTISFKILSGAGCTPARSDEFTATTLGSQWLKHTRNGGTPDGDLSFADGKLTIKTADFEIDAASATTSVGPINFIGQDLNSLGENWEVESQFTVRFNGGWQNASLAVWQADNNFFRTSITHSLSDGTIYTEQSKDNPTTTEGARVQSGGNATILPNSSQPVTVRMRMARVDGADSVTAQYRIVAPESVASADWVNFGATNGTWNNSGGLQLNPTGGPRRDAPGSRIGIMVQSNFPGTNGNFPYGGTPGTVEVDYFRVSPDPVTCETDAPTTTATLDPAAPATGDTYTRSVKVNLSATDGAGAGVEATEYRITTNGVEGEWKSFENANNDSPFVNQLTVSSSGTHLVEFRSSDKAANTEATKSVTFKVQLPVCDRSDEFDGTELRGHWLRHTRNGGTPTTGDKALSLTGTGILRLPTNDFELDASSATTALGPVNFIGQDLAALGDSWQVETQFKIHHNGGWQHVGLIVWQADNNFFRSTITHSLSGDNIYVEQSKDNPTTPEGSRQTAGGNRTLLPDDSQPVTIKMRYTRTDGSNSVQGQYQVIAPESIANDDWVDFPATSGGWNSSGGLQLNPTGGPRRDSEGSRIGIIAAGNFPGNSGAGAYEGVPAVAEVDYFRVTPDNCPPEADQTAPTTSHALDPATPNGQGGYYTSAVNVTLTGTDNAGGSGIDKTEYRIGEGAFGAYTAPISVSNDGDTTIEYRSVDKNGNVEATKSVAVKLDQVAPVSAAQLEPGTPGPGGTYDGPVGLALTGTDATSGVAKLEYQVNAVGAFGAFGFAGLSEALEWVTYDPENKPVFSAAGQYSIDYRATDVAGNVETAKSVAFSIRAAQTDDDAPVTTATLDPAQPGPGKTYSSAVNVNLSALDPSEAGPAPKTVDVDAFGNSWDPATVNITNGDTVRWNFPADEHQPHDVWTVPPGGNPAPGSADLTQVTPGPRFPGEPSVTKTLTENGTWSFICRLHSTFAEGAWSGMVGSAVVVAGGATNPPSGVDYTEYRVKTGDAQGDWVRKTNDGGANPFASTFQITAEGSHTVEYRSVDEAGNSEETKSVAFSIDLPDPGFPVIQAFADPASGTAPLLVRFTATGFDPDGGTLSYKWEFADGTALGRAVTRTYTTAGTYTAKVTATDDEGNTSSKDVQVVVTAPDVVPPTVEATSDSNRGPAPLRVQFNAEGNDPDGPESGLLYTWDFGDGGTSLAQNPAHTYTTPGTYTAKVTVSEESGAIATDTVEIVVTDPVGNRPPTVQVGALPLTGDAPLEVQLTAEGSDPDNDELTYTWDFDDGSAAGHGWKVNHTYEDGGTYTATVTASDGRGETGTAEIPIVVGDPPGNQAPTVVAAADPGTGTAPLTVEFSSHAIDPDGDDLLVTWAFGDGGQAAGTEATHTYTAAGTYTATVTAMDPSGATGTATVQVVVSAPPTQQQRQQVNTVTPAGTRDAAPAPEVDAWFGVSKPASTTVARFAKRGLSVRVTCTEAMRGTAKLTVSSKTRKALDLKRRTLATGRVHCDGAGSERVKLKVSKTVRRALASTKRSVKATLTVRLRASGEPASKSTRRVTLKRH